MNDWLGERTEEKCGEAGVGVLFSVCHSHVVIGWFRWCMGPVNPNFGG